MAEWIEFDQWKDCAKMQRPGFIFEVSNVEGLSLFTPCVVPLQLPFNWKAKPLRFRLVEAPKPRHSKPFPLPQRP